jgi:WhiB family redox-sensing transcriptional regulator
VSAPGLMSPGLIDAVAGVLESGRTTALRSWDKDKVDVYHVAARAWRAHGMTVPLAAVFAQLRRVVPDGNVLVYQDVEGRTRADIAEIFVQARAVLLEGCGDPRGGQLETVGAAQ